MKIRNRRVIRGLARLVAFFCRALFKTARTDVRTTIPGMSPYDDTGDDKYLYCIWHDAILANVFSGRCHRMAGLVSRHADGSYVADAMECVGIHPIRGSSSQGGAEAMKQMMEAAAGYHIAIATDGPRGPRRVVKDGIVFLASQTGRGIIPVGYAARRGWFLRGRWTDMALPRPFGRAWLYGAKPIYVPKGLSRRELEPYRLQVQQAMDAMNAEVERLATGAEQIVDPGTVRRAA